MLRFGCLVSTSSSNQRRSLTIMRNIAHRIRCPGTSVARGRPNHFNEIRSFSAAAERSEFDNKIAIDVMSKLPLERSVLRFHIESSLKPQWPSANSSTSTNSAGSSGGLSTLQRVFQLASALPRNTNDVAAAEAAGRELDQTLQRLIASRDARQVGSSIEQLAPLLRASAANIPSSSASAGLHPVGSSVVSRLLLAAGAVRGDRGAGLTVSLLRGLFPDQLAEVLMEGTTSAATWEIPEPPSAGAAAPAVAVPETSLLSPEGMATAMKTFKGSRMVGVGLLCYRAIGRGNPVLLSSTSVVEAVAGLCSSVGADVGGGMTAPRRLLGWSDVLQADFLASVSRSDRPRLSRTMLMHRCLLGSKVHRLQGENADGAERDGRGLELMRESFAQWDQLYGREGRTQRLTEGLLYSMAAHINVGQFDEALDAFMSAAASSPAAAAHGHGHGHGNAATSSHDMHSGFIILAAHAAEASLASMKHLQREATESLDASNNAVAVATAADRCAAVLHSFLSWQAAHSYRSKALQSPLLYCSTFSLLRHAIRLVDVANTSESQGGGVEELSVLVQKVLSTAYTRLEYVSPSAPAAVVVQYLQACELWDACVERRMGAPAAGTAATDGEATVDSMGGGHVSAVTRGLGLLRRVYRDATSPSPFRTTFIGSGSAAEGAGAGAAAGGGGVRACLSDAEVALLVGGGQADGTSLEAVLHRMGPTTAEVGGLFESNELCLALADVLSKSGQWRHLASLEVQLRLFAAHLPYKYSTTGPYADKLLATQTMLQHVGELARKARANAEGNAC